MKYQQMAPGNMQQCLLCGVNDIFFLQHVLNRRLSSALPRANDCSAAGLPGWQVKDQTCVFLMLQEIPCFLAASSLNLTLIACCLLFSCIFHPPESHIALLSWGQAGSLCPGHAASEVLVLLPAPTHGWKLTQCVHQGGRALGDASDLPQVRIYLPHTARPLLCTKSQEDLDL